MTRSEPFKKSYFGKANKMNFEILQSKRNLDIDKLGITLEELKKIKVLPNKGNCHYLLSNISEQIINHSRIKKLL